MASSQFSAFFGSLSAQHAIFHVTYPFDNLDGIIDSGYLIGSFGATLNGFLNAPKGSIRREIANKLIRPNPDTMVSGVKESMHLCAQQEKFFT